jgi:hypothetical protein
VFYVLARESVANYCFVMQAMSDIKVQHAEEKY